MISKIRLKFHIKMEVDIRRHRTREIQEFLRQSRLVGNVLRRINPRCSFLCIHNLARLCIRWSQSFHIHIVCILLDIAWGTQSDKGTSLRCCLGFSSYIQLLVCILCHLHRLGIKLLLLVLCKVLGNCGSKKGIHLFGERYLENLILQFLFLDRRYHLCL